MGSICGELGSIPFFISISISISCEPKHLEFSASFLGYQTPPKHSARCLFKTNKERSVLLSRLREGRVSRAPFRPLPPAASELRLWQSGWHPWPLVMSLQTCVTLLICILGFPNTFLLFHKASVAKRNSILKECLGESFRGLHEEGVSPDGNWWPHLGPGRACLCFGQSASSSGVSSPGTPGHLLLGLGLCQHRRGLCWCLRFKPKARKSTPHSPGEAKMNST